MRRWLLWDEQRGSDSLDQIVTKVRNELENDKSRIQSLTSLDLSNDIESAKYDLKRIFDTLCKLKIKHVDKHGRRRQDDFGVVATGKLMHMLFPRLCIIWDNTKVLDKKFGGKHLEKTSRGYYDYLHNKREELVEVMQNFGKEKDPRIVIEKEHSEFLASRGFEAINEPITKLLDECNYYNGR